MDAEGLGRKLLLTPPPRRPSENPEKQTVGTVTASHKVLNPASTFEVSQSRHCKSRLPEPRKGSWVAISLGCYRIHKTPQVWEIRKKYEKITTSPRFGPRNTKKIPKNYKIGQKMTNFVICRYFFLGPNRKWVILFSYFQTWGVSVFCSTPGRSQLLGHLRQSVPQNGRVPFYTLQSWRERSQRTFWSPPLRVADPPAGWPDGLRTQKVNTLSLPLAWVAFLEDRNLLKLRSLDPSCPFFPSDNRIWGQWTLMLQMLWSQG